MQRGREPQEKDDLMQIKGGFSDLPEALLHCLLFILFPSFEKTYFYCHKKDNIKFCLCTFISGRKPMKDTKLKQEKQLACLFIAESCHLHEQCRIPHLRDQEGGENLYFTVRSA